MSSLAEERQRPPPKPPSVPHMVAVLLELSIVVTFAANRSGFGLLLCLAYGWFSATWALFQKPDDK